MAKLQDVCIESSLPIVQINGLNTNQDTYLCGALEVVGAITLDAAADFVGNVTVGGTLGVTGAVDLISTLNVGSSITATGAISSVSTVTAKNATAFPAAGASSALAYGFSSVSGQCIYFGTGSTGGATGFTAATGSIYMNAAGSATNDRFYVAKGGTAWTAVLTSA